MSPGICHGCNSHKEALGRDKFDEYMGIRWVRSTLEEFQMQSQYHVKCIPSLGGILTVSAFTRSSRISYTTRETHAHTHTELLS